MPGSVQNATPTTVLPQSLWCAFAHAREYPVLENEYRNGESQRSLQAVTSRKRWRLAKGLTPTQLAEPFKFEDQGKTIERKLSPDRVYGYQVGIATRESASSGNVYDEARRGRFLDDFATRPAAKIAFKDREWNKYRIECKGASIRTWVNNILAADFQDSMTAKGIIGLQVHAVGKDRVKPFQVRWRNIRIKELN